ncbi:MAG: hypothetical protein JWN04_1264 [Myxococcaceae bacterium]|nr:hypothetical protein [Myxococcaceae bacterium]
MRTGRAVTKICLRAPYVGEGYPSSVPPMRLSSWQWERGLQVVGLTCLGLMAACDNSPVPDSRKQDLTVGGEVYRMFCMRVARAAYPHDPSGYRFVPLCEGTSSAVPPDIRSADSSKQLVALIERRPQTVAALDQVFGDRKVADSQTFAAKELEDWLGLLLPFYGSADPTGDNVVPRSTEALSAVMTQLTDPKNQAVLDTIARISTRVGYRSPDRVLAAVRPTLTYSRIDELTKALLALVAKGASGHDAFLGVLQAAALELAQPAETAQDPSTLDLALDLLLRSGPDGEGVNVNDLFVKAEPGPLAPLPVLLRDDHGDAIPLDPSDTPTPFLVAGRDDNTKRDNVTQLALTASNIPAYQIFDANETALASLMRDSVSLIQRGNNPRSTVEMLLRSSRTLLGKPMAKRTEAFGDAKTLTYAGTDVEHGPMASFLHAFTTMLKLPQTKPLLKLLDQLIQTNEPAATELIYAALQIRAESKKPEYDSAQLGGGKPHEFWDDLIGFGQDLIVNRKGALLDILNATLDPLTAAQGPILAHQMQFADQVKLASATDINSDVTTGCPTATPAAAYCVPVDRTMGDVATNRSVFQRTLSLIHATYKVENCNKEGATLTVQQPVPTTFPNPGFPASLIGCPDSTLVPPPAKGYPHCVLIEQKNATVTQMRAILGEAKVVIKDDEVVTCAKAAGSDLATTQETESGIKGFTLSPTAKAIARFTYAPRTKFLTDMFDPLPTIDSKPGAVVNLVDYEPNGIYPLELTDPDAVDALGAPQSFLTAVKPLLMAFDKYEPFDAKGDPAPDATGASKYYFAELLNLLHMHYSSPKSDPCAVPVDPAKPGCVQSADPTLPFYVHGTNLVSYEPLISYALTQQKLLGVLQRSTQAFKNINIDGQDGVQILEAFLEAVLTPNPEVKYRDGTSFAKTNTCVVMTGPDGNPACTPDASGTPVGRIIKGGVPPLYLLVDALNDIDAMWAQNQENHNLYLQVRSTLVDKLLDVTKASDATTSFTNRRAYALTRRALPWLIERLDQHQTDLPTWADTLVDRLAGVLGHPLAARGMDLFDQFWQNQAAGDEVAQLLAYLFDDKANPDAFTGAVIAASDTLTFVDKDPDLTPAIRFAALLLADDAIDIVEGNSDADTPNVEEGTAFRFLEVTRKIGEVDDKPALSTLAKLLRNAVLPMAGNDLAGKSPLEEFIDLVAEVDRVDPSLPSEQTLDADDDRLVFQKLKDFLSSDEVGLERLYNVIENRDIK